MPALVLVQMEDPEEDPVEDVAALLLLAWDLCHQDSALVVRDSARADCVALRLDVCRPCCLSVLCNSWLRNGTIAMLSSTRCDEWLSSQSRRGPIT